MTTTKALDYIMTTNFSLMDNQEKIDEHLSQIDPVMVLLLNIKPNSWKMQEWAKVMRDQKILVKDSREDRK